MNQQELEQLVGADRAAELLQEIQNASTAELLQEFNRDSAGSHQDLPFEIEERRQRALESPFTFMTEIMDDFYRKRFLPIHGHLLDEVLAPWFLGETVRIEGVNYDPKGYTGILIIFPRSTYKSSICQGFMAWAFLVAKLAFEYDLSCAYTHKVEAKAIDKGEGLREMARRNPRFVKHFPEFHVSPDFKDWDKQSQWRWLNCDPEFVQATNWSFQAYGATSSKVGGHYKLRITDDWEDEETVGTSDSIQKAERKFNGMDNLGIAGEYSPWITVGTFYHYQGVYRRLMEKGAWLPWVVPAHEGSSKVIFDMVAMDPHTDRRKIEKTLVQLENTRAEDLNFPGIYDWRELYMKARGQQNADGGGEAGGFLDYNCQVLCNPVPEGHAKFNIEVLDSAMAHDLPGPSEMQLVIRVDPALAENRRNDECAIVVGGIKWNSHRYVCETWAGHEKRASRIVHKIMDMADRWRSLGYAIQNIGVEEVAFQKAIKQMLEEGVPMRPPKYNGEPVPVRTIPDRITAIPRGNQASKFQRIQGLDGPIGRAQLHLYRGDPMFRKVRTQLMNFPQDRDDILDCLHDLWIRCKLPPKPLQARMELTQEESVAAVLDMIRSSNKKPTRSQTAQTVRLSKWRD